jgi:hypothetical protein
MLFLLLLRPIYDVDIFWQLKLGEQILANRGPVPAEPFAATHLGEPLPPLAWLGQAIYAEARLLGGWTAVRVFDALLWVGGFWVVAVACRRSGTPVVAVLVAVGVGFMAAMPCASLRPQSFAALGFGLLLALLRLELSPLRTLLLAVPLFVLWQNLHPSITVAVVALAAAMGVAWLRCLAKHRPAPWLLTALTVLAAVATFATPAGFSILRVSKYNAEMSRDLGVDEWLPPWVEANHRAALPFAVGALLAAWLLARNRERVNWEELAPAAAFFVLTLTAHRFALFWGIAVVPVLARVLANPRPNPPSPFPAREGGASPPPPRGRGLGVGSYLLTPAILAVAIALSLLIRPTHFRETLPLAGVAKLKETGVTGVIYCRHAWGGPLIDAGYPEWTVAFDGRYYRYTPEEWHRYTAVVRGEIGLAELDRVYHPAAYFLRPGADDKLIAALRADKSWREVHADRTCAAFVRSP